MAKKKENSINWTRIVAVAGLSFCTTAAATGLNTYSAIISACLAGLVALFSELKTESEPIIKIQKAVSNALII